MSFFFKNREKRKKFAHIGAGIVILIHAYEKYESGHGSYLLFGIAGLIFLLIAALHQKIEEKLPWVDGVFFVIEGILSLIVAYEFFHVGKKALPVTYVLLALFQFTMALRKGKKGIDAHKKSEEIKEA
ncbi:MULTISPECIES: hypothetical protein [unclassified Paraflavitalea]|uniref:hypothetical protein n=1 Tax=unclassified Paraflavitalea TaxID=2798305 RepID=UPI003D348194